MCHNIARRLISIGILVAFLLGLFVPWRLLAVLGTLPCAVLIPGLFFIPESPRWLAKLGMMEDFEASLQLLRGFDTDISQELEKSRNQLPRAAKRATIRVADLKHKRYWFPLVLGIGLFLQQQYRGINGFIYYSSKIFQGAGITNSNMATCGFGTVQVIATAFSAGLVDKAGRRILLLLSTWGMTVSLFLVAASFFIEEHIPKTSGLHAILGMVSVTGVISMGIFFSLGIGSIPWIFMSEILLMNIKRLAGSIATLASWFVAWLATIMADLLLNWSPRSTFMIYNRFRGALDT